MPRSAKKNATCQQAPARVCPPESFTDAGNGATAGVQRLNKAIADTGLCSRRKADALILSGEVYVNGELERNPGRRVGAGDCLRVGGRTLARAQERVCLMLHKPVHMVSTVSDPDGRPTVLDALPAAYRSIRLYPVGRLDYFSEGLLLLTNDGQLAQRLTHPRHHLPKSYEVDVREQVTERALAAMRHGMRLAEGDVTLPADVGATPLPSGRTRLHLVLRQGLNRQIRRMCRDLDLTILRLRRVAQGPLALGDLPSGAVRPLSARELAALRASVGLLDDEAVRT